MFLGAALLDPYRTEQPRSDEEESAVPRDHLSLPQRLGYATLLNAGYADVVFREFAPRDSQHRTGEGMLELTPRPHEDLACLRDLPEARTRAGVAVSLRNLATSIAAAERYNRGDLERGAELAVAGLGLRWRGRVPSLSLGVAQIRPELARTILAKQLEGAALPEQDLLTMLRDPCQNVRLAAFHLADLVARDSTATDEQEAVVDVALDFNGAASETGHGLRYADAVAGAYGLLTPYGYEGEGNEEEGAVDTLARGAGRAIDATTVRAIRCLAFAFGGAAPDSSPGGWRAVPEGDSLRLRQAVATGGEVTVMLHAVEHGPPSYLRRLAELRQRWLVGWLAAQGFPRARIRVTTGAPASAVLKCIEGGEMPPMALIEGRFSLAAPTP